MAEASKEVEAVSRIAVDWDGTLVEEKWPEMGDWLPGAVDALKDLARHYDEVAIFSCRLAEWDTDEVTPRDNYDQIVEMNQMLEEADIPPSVKLWTRNYKPPAEFYVDDRAIRHSGNWSVTTAAVLGASKHSDSDPGDEDDQAAMYTPGWVMEQMNRESAEEYRDEHTYWATIPPEDVPSVRTFETGATRDTDDGKLDYEGFLSPLVLRRYAEYMHKHRIQSDGTVRSSDNWQKGIPRDAYMKSAFRHFMDWWGCHRGDAGGEDPDIEEAICALIFNASGYLRELMLD